VVQECVCALDGNCCEDSWSAGCVDLATTECLACGPFCGDGECKEDESCLNCAADCSACGDESCCTEHDTSGCIDPAVQLCVCASKPECCDSEWKEECVATAKECGSCAGDCCAPNDSPGCEEGAVEKCVCEIDPLCCNQNWDGVCVMLGEQQCDSCGPECGDGLCNGEENCADCPDDCFSCGEGECCVANGSPGCEVPEVQTCVCKDDPWCCNASWDGTCAAGAISCGGCEDE
jgi:hypothetical protein